MRYFSVKETDIGKTVTMAYNNTFTDELLRKKNFESVAWNQRVTLNADFYFIYFMLLHVFALEMPP